jgi:hypothetical protein
MKTPQKTALEVLMKCFYKLQKALPFKQLLIKIKKMVKVQILKLHKFFNLIIRANNHKRLPAIAKNLSVSSYIVIALL